MQSLHPLDLDGGPAYGHQSGVVSTDFLMCLRLREYTSEECPVANDLRLHLFGRHCARCWGLSDEQETVGVLIKLIGPRKRQTIPKQPSGGESHSPHAKSSIFT